MTHQDQSQIRALLLEVPTIPPGSYRMPLAQRVRSAHVNYYAETPRGSKTRFNRVLALTQIRGAMSETAVYFYLKSLHPGCNVTIMSLEFR
jgi:hypothetical protein